MAASGLEAVAGNAGGTVIRVQGTSPDVAFDRVLLETSGHYLLGVESIADDRDGQPHPIRVRVKRGGTQVRSRTFVTIAPVKKDQREPPIAAIVAGPPGVEDPASGPSASAPEFGGTQTDHPDQSLKTVLARVVKYLSDYERQATAVVLEESYRQRVAVERGGPPETRLLRSDVLLISDAEFEWMGFRDVFEVDGRAVRNRDQRLTKLFLGERTGALEQARRIALESSRYNLNAGAVIVERSVNMPMTALRFLISEHQWRSEFKDLGPGTLDGAETILVEFNERAKPRIITTGDESPASGRFWIDPRTGTVVRSELMLDVRNEAYNMNVSVRLRVSFARDEKLAMWLPVEMEEEYRTGRVHITGNATYSNPRRFGVTTTETIK